MKPSLFFRIALVPWLFSTAILTAQNAPIAQTQPPATQPPARRSAAGDSAPAAPAVLPGRGLAQHDFFYAGEGGGRHNMYIVRKGKVDWSYENTDPQSKGEISDATLLSNGNVLFAHQFGVTEITAAKKVVWNYDAPPGTEIHTAQAIGREHVVFIRNGNPAKLLVVNTTSGATEKEFELPVGNANSVHGQFRHARLTDAGTILVGHMDLHKICEYDINGKQLWSLVVPDLWMAAPLKNGNILMTREHTAVQELDRKGTVVWEFPSAGLAGYKISGMQTATRLSNGDTLINNWCNKGSGPAAGTAIQAFEVSADKQLVWALRAWGDPVDLGPSTTIQVLDEPSVPENVHFGDIK
jgi:outer membrane protein assembly factor BamB